VVPPAEPRGRFGIEVAAFIFPDRAEAERARLAAAVGERARVVTEWENGAPTYRVVLGPYVSRAAAERAADTVLQAGLVQQARVVNVPRDR
jgi:cell division protein FtsN